MSKVNWVGRRVVRRTLLLTATVLAVTSGSASGATLSFTGAFSRDWNTAANWTSTTQPAVHAVPTALDDVLIGLAAAPVLGGGADGAARSITLEAGASVTVSGRGLAVAGGAPSSFRGDLALSTATLTLGGASTWSAGAWSLAGSTVDNAGEWRITGDVTATGDAGSAIANTGTIVRDDDDPATGTASLTARVENRGRLDVTDGRVALSRGGTHSGSFALAAGAVLAVAGEHTLAGSVTGPGTLQLDGGAFAVPGSAGAFAPGTLLLSGGFVDLGKLSTIARLTSDGEGGGRRGSATLFAGGPTLLENVTLDSGTTTLTGPAVTLRALSMHAATLNLQPGTQVVWDSGSWELLGTSINNFGDLSITGDGRAAVTGDGAFFNNRVGGTVTRDDADPATGTAGFTASVKNDGRISVVGGVLELAGVQEEPSGGTFDLGARGTLSVATAFALERGGAITGAGALRLDAGALSVPPGGGRFDPATVVFSGGYLSLGRDATVGRLTSDGEGGGRTGGVATLNAGGPTVLDNVLLFGPGTTNLTGPAVTLRTLTAGGGSRLALAAGTSARWDAGDWRLGEAVVSNAGELVVSGDGSVRDTGGLPLVQNLGTLVRDDADPSSGSATFAAQLRNSGTLHVARGALDPGELGEQDAGLTTVDTAAVLGGPGARYALTAGRLEGAGTVAGTLVNTGGTVAPADVLSVNGSYVQGADATLETELAGNGGDRLAVRDDATLAGTLAVTTAAGFEPPPGSVFDIVTAGTLSGTFGVVTGAAAYRLEYSTAPGRVRLRVPGTATPPPQGGVPSIPATAHSGSVLVCDPGTWTPEPTGFTFAWLRNGVPIAGASSAAYTVTEADVDQSLRCQTIAHGAGGDSAPALSNAVVPVPAAPANLAPPRIPAKAQPGDILHCDGGRWSGEPALTFAWLRDGVVDASGPSRTVATADVGHALRCRVDASNRGGTASAESASVTPSAGPGTPPSSEAPTNTVAPRITGRALVGRWLVCHAGVWTGKPRFAYRWLRDGRRIVQANTPSYRVRARDVGERLACRVVATNAAGRTTARSAAVTPHGGHGR